MDNFFVNAFAGSQSMGLMSLQSKLHFLKHHCERITPDSSFEEKCYFQYVYKGLIKAANPSESGDASYPEHRCYFTTKYGNPDGYVNYQGKYFPFSTESFETEADYHYQAIRVLLSYYNRQQGSNINTCEDALVDITECFEVHLASVTINIETYLLYIIDVPSIIAAEINLDNLLLKKLNNFLVDIEKGVENNFKEATTTKNSTSNIFDPHQTYELQKLHISRIQKILQWRKENQFHSYEIKDKELPLSQVSITKNLKKS
jgi:hypothetical protein